MKISVVISVVRLLRVMVRVRLVLVMLLICFLVVISISVIVRIVGNGLRVLVILFGIVGSC